MLFIKIHPLFFELSCTILSHLVKYLNESTSKPDDMILIFTINNAIID